MENRDVKCGKCKSYKYPSQFLKEGRQMKTCSDCRERGRKCIEKNKCEHGKRRDQCKECGGSSVCPHDRQRSTCKECSDPIKVTITNMIAHSKQSDKKHDRYDPVNLVDRCFLENLLDDYKQCYYKDCKCDLQLVEYADNLATIERLDNSIGHIKSNCVICCKRCNCMKKSDK